MTYDILIYQHQLTSAIELVRALPNQLFVLDHLAKPMISSTMDKAWSSRIRELALSPNVYCKVSGMVTETTHDRWKKDDFIPYLDVVFNAFGVDRIMYGSDWPVCLLAADYQLQLTITQDYISSLTENEQAKVMGRNASIFYNLG